jgi:transposase
MKTMYDVAEILKYYNEYGSIREVQRRTRISRNTIAKYLARVEENKKDQSLEIIRSKQRTMSKRTNELIKLPPLLSRKFLISYSPFTLFPI